MQWGTPEMKAGSLINCSQAEKLENGRLEAEVSITENLPSDKPRLLLQANKEQLPWKEMESLVFKEIN